MKYAAHPLLPLDIANAEALTELTLLVFRLNGVLLQWGDALVEPLGLTSARWQMLGAIAFADKPLTAPRLGQTMGVTRQGAQKQLNLLVDKGLVETHPNPAHLRSQLYTLTPRGRQLYKRAEALWMARAAEIGARLSSAKLKATRTTLGVMLHQLDTVQNPEHSP